MGPTVLLTFRRKARWGSFRPEKSDGFGRVWTRELGYQRPGRQPVEHRSRSSRTSPSGAYFTICTPTHSEHTFLNIRNCHFTFIYRLNRNLHRTLYSAIILNKTKMSYHMCSETFRLRDIRHRHLAQGIKWTILGAFIATLMRGAVDDSLETDLPSAGRVTYKIRRQNVRRETSFWILTILVRYGVSVSIFLSSYNCNYDILRDWNLCRPWAT
jgi:hypothetical protein